MAIGKHGYVAPPPPRLLPPPSVIRNEFVYPPIPDRSHDWLAFLEGREEDTRFYGWGRTGEAARGELAAAMEAWGEEAGERTQWAWQGAEDRLRES